MRRVTDLPYRQSPSPPSGRCRTRPARPVVYRRRRLVAAGVLAAAAFTAGVLLTLVITARPARGALTDDARQAEHTTHVVAPGDTLWSIASTLEPGRDPRPVVDAIAGARGSATVRPGEVITWPIE